MNDTIALTSEIVANFVTGNKIAAAELPALIQSVYSTLTNVGTPAVEAAPETVKATAAQVRKSITDSGLVSFEDGKTYQSLKRNLATRGLTPEQYREKWGLPRDYPMVSPAYAAKRSALAKSMGLGRKGGQTAAPQSPQKDDAAPKPASRGKTKSK